LVGSGVVETITAVDKKPFRLQRNKNAGFGTYVKVLFRGKSLSARGPA